MTPDPPTGRGLRPRLWPSATMLRSDFMAGSAPERDQSWEAKVFLEVLSTFMPRKSNEDELVDMDNLHDYELNFNLFK